MKEIWKDIKEYEGYYQGIIETQNVLIMQLLNIMEYIGIKTVRNGEQHARLMGKIII